MFLYGGDRTNVNIVAELGNVIYIYFPFSIKIIRRATNKFKCKPGCTKNNTGEALSDFILDYLTFNVYFWD